VAKHIEYALLATLLILSFATISFAQVPQVQHVLIVLEENTDYADVCGPNNASMPFLCGLKSQGSFSANYYAPTHPSIGNYDDLGWGVVTTNNDSCNPNTCGFPYSANNIVRASQAAGKTWKGYAESLPSSCYFGGDNGSYAVRHSPIPYLSDVQSNCQNRYVAFEDPNLGFAHDLANNTLPNFAFITPNLCDDGHDCTLPGSAVPDQWLQNNVLQPLLNSGHLNPTTGDTVVIVTFDESNADNTNGGGQVYWFMMGKGVKQNYQSSGPSAAPGFYSHESSLRVIAEMLGASLSGLGGAGSAPDMAEFFGITSNGLSVSPLSLTFTAEPIGVASPKQTVVLINTSSGAVTFTSITPSGDFAQTNTCGASLAANAQCTISVTFTPTAFGARTGTIILTDSAMGSPNTINLSGTGAPDVPTALLSATTLNFPSQTVGSTSAQQTVTLSNPGSAPLLITGIAISGTNAGDFAQTNNCGNSLAPGAPPCNISVTFTPTAAGTRTASVTITDNAAGSPQAITLTGTATTTSLSLAPASGGSTSQTVKAGQTATYNMQLSATGGTIPVSVTITCAGAPSLATCSGPSSAVSVTPGTPAPFTITVTTTGTAMFAPGTPSDPKMLPPAAIRTSPLAILGVLLSIAAMLTWRQSPAGRMRAVRMAFAACLILMPISATALLVGCGGGSSSPTPTPKPSTPAGTYTLTVTATATGASQTTQLTLIVQ
jgi:hypothetical protein